MQASVEISMYPLKEDYKSVIKEFIEKISKNQRLQVEVNGMSTQIFGDYDEMMETLQPAMKEIFEDQKAMFIMKVGAGTLKS